MTAGNGGRRVENRNKSRKLKLHGTAVELLQQNGAACNRCTANRAKCFATCRLVYSLIGQAFTGGYSPIITRLSRPTLSQTFDLASRQLRKISELGCFIGNIERSKFRFSSSRRVYAYARMNYGHFVLQRCTKVVKIPLRRGGARGFRELLNCR